MRRNLTGMVLLLVWVLVLPYLSRLYRGLDWVRQYVPDDAVGLVALALLNAIPAAALLLPWFLRERFPVTWYVTFTSVTLVICFVHHDYDLSSDAQAGIALLIFPFFILVPGLIVFAVSAVIEGLVSKKGPPPVPGGTAVS